MGNRRVRKEFQYDLASNKAESQIRKYESPELELDQEKSLVWKMSGLGQKVYKFMISR